jgi:arsenate reductase-like glutaredoxin family protein
MILKELDKIDISARLDQTTKDFKNKGQRLSYHANSFEVCFYDKRKELEQYKKFGAKRTDEDGSMQLELLDRMAFDPLEVFRIEYRLNTKRKIKAEFAKRKIDTDLKFESVFKKDISKKLLIGIWQVFEDKFDYTLHNTNDPIALLEGVFKSKSDVSLLNALAASMGFYIASSGDGGMKRFRDCIEKYSDLRSWHRIKDQLKGIKLSPSKTKLEMLLQITKQLEQFEPTKLKNYPQFDYLQCKQ